jgi:outer membrane protein OmpA-like peptidoglycan-associated protein
MPTTGFQADEERLQKRWILGALALAFLIHLIAAWAMGWYKLPAMEIPAFHTPPVGPFTVKRIEVSPDALKPQQEDPIAKLPAAEPPANPADFNLDPNQIEKALQTPQPMLATPTMPEPNKVIAATDLSHNLPMISESDTAKITDEISQVDPAVGSGPVNSAQLAQDLISANSGRPQPGQPGGAPAQGNGVAGQLPGFAALAPNFKQTAMNLSNLPEPVLLRLPSDVLFDFDSAQLKPEADPLLGQAVALITKYPQADVHIDGYTDSFGKPDYNQTLSLQRAQAVQAWLQQRIAQTAYTFKSQGHGGTSFIVPATASIEQQQPNRRVEILIQALKP